MERKSSINWQENKFKEENDVCVKEEDVVLCRVCETEENLLDISTEEFKHLNVKLYRIADFGKTHNSYNLRFICTSCSIKLENAFDFKTQCEYTFQKLVDRLDGSDPIDPLIGYNSDAKDEDFAQEVKQEQPDVSTNEYQYLPPHNIWDHSYMKEEKHSEAEIKKRGRKKVDKSQNIFMCAICDWTFKAKSRLKDHIEGQHLQKKRYTCPTCKVKYTFASSLYRHRLIQHSDKTYACESCGKSFKTKMYLTRHMKIHSNTRKPAVRRHLCHLCGYNATDKTHHTEHMHWHAGIKPHKCGECGKDFVRKDALRLHERIHSSDRSTGSAAKLCICQICSKGFRTNAQMKIHLATHTGEKKYKCKFCSKAYTQASGLTFHLRTHTGEKPYECPTCLKKFSMKHVLRNHQRIHTGERPFDCSSCGKKFRSQSNLRRHMKICPGSVDVTKESS